MTLNNCGKKVQVVSLEDASKIIRQTIVAKTIGSTKWYSYKDNGLVTENDQVIAQISFNGRIWTTANDIAQTAFGEKEL